MKKSREFNKQKKERLGIVKRVLMMVLTLALILSSAGFLVGCGHAKDEQSNASSTSASTSTGDSAGVGSGSDGEKGNKDAVPEFSLMKDFRSAFVHGEKGDEHQKYIMLHDTEGEGDAASVINGWDNGKGVAAHFVINKDGTVWQCVPMDKIAHHAGFGNAGHNEKYDVTDESRDDRVGTEPIGSEYPDYGMNSYSIGIEMVHVGGSGDYPVEQLEALDKLIAYIDEYYGFECDIIDHKTWRTTNSDTSAEFANYLRNYQNHRSYK